jgi:hypothetical protein
MSSAVSSVTLTQLCFPDITGATLGAYLSVSFGAGTYTTGGIPMGLVLYADQRTIDFNNFLVCAFYDETSSDSSGVVYSFRYIPTTDSVQIFSNGTELASGASVAITDSVLAHAVWNRTTTLG